MTYPRRVVAVYVANAVTNTHRIMHIRTLMVRTSDEKLLREYIEMLIICEAPVPLKKPQTREQANAFIKLLRWAADKMEAPANVVSSAIDSAMNHNIWDDAIELLRDFYVMKGIKFQAA